MLNNTTQAMSISPAVLITLFFSLALPIGLLIWWKKKTGEKFWCFLAGALCFLVFAYGLESLLHTFCLRGNNSISRTITASPVLYTLYGSFAAGIFEETARLFGFKVLLRKHSEKECSVAYGIGHGCIEVMLLLGTTYTIYLLAQAGVRIGDAAATARLAEIANTVPLSSAFLAMFERISAVMLHIGLSMLMFIASRVSGKLWYYPLSICIHALADVPACLYQFGILSSVPLIEIIGFAMGLLILLVGKHLLNKYFHTVQNCRFVNDVRLKSDKKKA